MPHAKKLAATVKFVWTLTNAKADLTAISAAGEDRAVSPPFATFSIGPGYLQIWRLEIGSSKQAETQATDADGTSSLASSSGGAASTANLSQIELQQTPNDTSSAASNPTATCGSDINISPILSFYLHVFAEGQQKIIPVHNIRLSIHSKIEDEAQAAKRRDCLFVRPDLPERLAEFSLSELLGYCHDDELIVSLEQGVKPPHHFDTSCDTNGDSARHYFNIDGVFSTCVSVRDMQLGTGMLLDNIISAFRNKKNAMAIASPQAFSAAGCSNDGGFRRIFEKIRGDGAEAFADVRLVCAEETFHCHRVILAQKSATFRTCFSNDAYIENQTCEMIIEDVSAEILYEILRYLYCGWLDNSAAKNNIEDILYATEKYQIQCLGDFISQSIFEKLNVDNACRHLLLGDRFNLAQVKIESMKLILNNRQRAVESEDWPTVAGRRDLVTEMFRLSLD